MLDPTVLRPFAWALVTVINIDHLMSLLNTNNHKSEETVLPLHSFFSISTFITRT